jgi:DNA primase
MVALDATIHALMALPPNFLDELRARTPMAALVARSVRLVRSRRDTKACCPFHGEKTPSFYVYDDHFHCFGCGEHGDAITFVMKTSGGSFIEAVEQLAAEAGMEVPKASPQAAEAEQRRAGISEILDAAAKTYQAWLFAPAGAAALSYLRNRGLSDDTIKKFGLGWSGEGRGALAAALRPQGITTAQLVEAGLMKEGESGPVDMFFSRVMFPIADRRGNKISFGGRILGDGQPKYVNGPETAAFSKRRSLYGLNFARDAVRKGAALIVVEGYMDVIALAQAGFGGAVAPLGTALTEDHLAEIWRLSPDPVICFDADAAGRRAALKTVDLALAALAPDRSLKFLRLPEKDDPDSVIKREGPAAFTQRLAAAQPISAALYDMLAEGVPRDTPEARASFHKRLVEAAGRIADKSLASEYRALLLQRFFEDRRGTRTKPGAKPDKPFIRSTAPADAADANLRRSRIMTAGLLAFPAILPDVEEAFSRLDLPPACDRLRTALHHFVAEGKPLDTDTLFTHLHELGLAEEARLVEAVAALDYRPDPDLSPAQAAQDWWSWFSLMDFSIDALRQQRDEQQLFWSNHQDDPAAWARLVKYNELLNQARTGEYGQDP